MLVHPAYDIKTSSWFLETGEEATTLSKLKQLLPKNTKIAGYYPKGYIHKITIQDEVRRLPKMPDTIPAVAQVAQNSNNPDFNPTIELKTDTTICITKPKTHRGPPIRYDHNQILNMWFDGLDAPTIARRLSIKRWTSVTNIVCNARINGDHRATSRNPRLADRKIHYG